MGDPVLGRLGVLEILRQLKSLTAEEITKLSSIMARAYQENLEENLGNKLVQFTELFKTYLISVIDSKKDDAPALRFSRLIMENSLESCFPNIEIVLGIYLSFIITNCSVER